MQGDCAARKAMSFPRVMRLRNRTWPAASAPCAWNTCFAMSNPIVVTCAMDASFSDGSTPSPWHADAVRGRPPHHCASSVEGDLLDTVRDDPVCRRLMTALGVG